MNKSLFLVTVLVSLLTLTALTVVPAQSDPAALREQLMQAIIRGDVAGAVALFAEDAVIDGVAGTGLCVAAPCVGKAAIQKDIERRVAAKNHPTTLNHYVSGTVLATRIEIRSDAIQKAGVDRIILWILYEMKGDKIAWERGPIYERTDPQTGRYVEWLRAQQPAR